MRTNFEEREGDEISDATLAAVKAESLYAARNAYELYDRITQFAIVPKEELPRLGFSVGISDLVAGKVLPFAHAGQDHLSALINQSSWKQLTRRFLMKKMKLRQYAGKVQWRRSSSAHLELLGPMSVGQVAARLALPERVLLCLRSCRSKTRAAFFS